MEDSEPVRRRGPPDLDGRSVSPPSRGVGPNSAGQRQAGGPDGEQLPARRIVVLLGNFVLPDITYNVAISDLENLYGVPQGGGEASFFIAPSDIDDVAGRNGFYSGTGYGVGGYSGREVGTR
ncbi:MAG: hypothetical protein Ct9H300mP15_08410 [Gemmatimonadota bacterium]|nr:MAG: hypothetical protein Ct9H300mP15_08410 [Gemmatimonadota bacterium]